MNPQVLAANALDALIATLPVGYAFGAGVVSTVNPCGFAMLPAYLALYLGTGKADFYERAALARSGRAVWIAAVMTAGFVLLFGTIGTVVSVGGRLVIAAMPWLGLLVGAALLGCGLWMLTGRSLSAGVFNRLAGHIGDPREVSARGFFLFGIAFGAASLSCTLPIFLTVVQCLYRRGRRCRPGPVPELCPGHGLGRVGAHRHRRTGAGGTAGGPHPAPDALRARRQRVAVGAGGRLHCLLLAGSRRVARRLVSGLSVDGASRRILPT
jgi:cytochrome c biogenesis protein CcdA